MIVSNEVIVEGQPVTFKVTGFPDEDGVRQSVERFYKLKTNAHRSFSIVNMFGDEIFSGRIDENGTMVEFNSFSPSGKKYTSEEKPE